MARVVFVAIEVPDDTDAFYYLQDAIVPGVNYQWLMGQQVFNPAESGFTRSVMGKDVQPEERKYRVAAVGHPDVHPDRYYVVRGDVAVIDQWPTGYSSEEWAQRFIDERGPRTDLHVVKGDQFEVADTPT